MPIKDIEITYSPTAEPTEIAAARFAARMAARANVGKVLGVHATIQHEREVLDEARLCSLEIRVARISRALNATTIDEELVKHWQDVERLISGETDHER